MNPRFRLSIVLAASLLTSLPGAAQTTDTLAKIKATGAIQLGGRDASFPFSYKLGADDPIGFSADLCLKLVDAIKTRLDMPALKVQYTVVTPANRIPLVQNGTIDLECSTTTNNASRQQQVAFAPTHFVAAVGIAVRKDSGITSLAQLEGKTVATVTGSTSIQLLRSYRRSAKADFTEVSGKDNAESFLLLSNNRAAALALDDVQLAGLIATSSNPGEFVILEERLSREPYGFTFRKNDPAFKALIDETMNRLMASGEAEALYAKWFMQPVPPRGVNLNFPMSDAVKEAYANPNNKGVQ